MRPSSSWLRGRTSTHRTRGEIRRLHVAATVGNAAVVAALLTAGADPDSGENFGPLREAVMFGHESVVALLLAAGAEVDSKDEDGETPLLQAA